MADFISFDEGQDYIGEGGLASDVYFDLSSDSVDATSPFTEADNYTSVSPNFETGTGYSRGTVSGPIAFTNGTTNFGTITYTTGAATDWSATTRSVVMTDGTVAICAWNLQAGGAARDLSAANTTENVDPTLIIA